MASFVFQLEGVLRHRERLEKDRYRDFAVVNGEMKRLEGELNAMNQELHGNSAEVRDNHLVGRLDLRYLAAHRRYMLGMQRKVHALAQRMNKQQVLVDEARRALSEASKQRKILEKLRERQFVRWTDAQARREASELDEVVAQMSFRQIQQAEVEQ
jgi:flagellar FliJ protein